MERITQFSPADRYIYDFRYCTLAKGWAQFDSAQDASYFGNWINPGKREWFSYCEGDTTLVRCDDDAEFMAYVRQMVSWYAEHDGKMPAIDALYSEPLVAEFRRLGLGDLLR